MNYRHQYHAGNFADVWKHALLLPLLRGMQRKEKGFLFLDTHAGRGRYDLAESETGDSRERKPEYPEGIGRLWNATELPSELKSYVELVKHFDRGEGNMAPQPRFYPGSPWLAQMVMRAQDRLALCELHPEEHEALRASFAGVRDVSVHALDGYKGLRAMIPPLEKRALALIDPPFEEKDEFTRIVGEIRECLRRMPAVTIAVWYPLTERAGADAFLDQVAMAMAQPCFAAELTVAGPGSALRMRGCGLLVVNPPWQIEAELRPLIEGLPKILAQGPGATGRLVWIVREK